jgi:hypothetical protein
MQRGKISKLNEIKRFFNSSMLHCNSMLMLQHEILINKSNEMEFFCELHSTRNKKSKKERSTKVN